MPLNVGAFHPVVAAKAKVILHLPGGGEMPDRMSALQGGIGDRQRELNSVTAIPADRAAGRARWDNKCSQGYLSLRSLGNSR